MRGGGEEGRGVWLRLGRSWIVELADGVRGRGERLRAPYTADGGVGTESR